MKKNRLQILRYAQGTMQAVFNNAPSRREAYAFAAGAEIPSVQSSAIYCKMRYAVVKSIKRLSVGFG